MHKLIYFGAVFIGLSASGMNFESEDCLKYWAALRSGDSEFDPTRIYTRLGLPADEAATRAMNVQKIKWAETRQSRVTADVEELSLLAKTVVPRVRKTQKNLRKQIEELRGHPEKAATRKYLESELDKVIAEAFDDHASVPHGYPSMERFFDYHFGTEKPSLEMMEFYGGEPARYLKASADYFTEFHGVLMKHRPGSSWDNLVERDLLKAQKQAISIYDKSHAKLRFDNVGGRSLLAEPAGSPARAEANRLLESAHRLIVDPTLPRAHQDLLRDHIAYLERYQFDPGARFIEYVRMLEARPRFPDGSPGNPP